MLMARRPMTLMARVDDKPMAMMAMARVAMMAMMAMARVDPPTVTGRLLAAGGRLILQRRPRTPLHL